MKKTYTVHYSFRLADSIDISADTEEQAREICGQKLLAGEIGNRDMMKTTACKIWVD